MLTAGFAEPPVPVDGRVTRAFLVRTEDFDQTSLSTVIVRPALSVFLYRVDFNKTMRAAWSQVTAHDGRPHLPLDLHFLLTPWGDNAEAESAILGDVRGKGLLMAIEIVADRETKAMLPAAAQAVYRIIELGIERGLLLYSRRTADGAYGEWLMVSPPLIVTAAEIEEIVALIGQTLAAYEAELRRANVI